MEFRLPPLGEGIDTATVTAVLVRPGDVVQAGQNILTVETDKAAVEVPIDVGGQVEAILVKPGDKIPIDTPILRLQPIEQKSLRSAAASSSSYFPASPPPLASASATASAPSAASGADVFEFLMPELGEGIESAVVTSVLVRPGETVQPGQNVLTVETDKAAVEVPIDRVGIIEAVHVQPGDRVPIGGRLLSLRIRDKVTAPTPPPIVPPTANTASSVTLVTKTSRSTTSNGDGQAAPTANHAAASTATVPSTATRELIPASPATRRLARELGVSLAEVPATGRGGRVTLEDVKNFVRSERQRFKGVAEGPPSAALTNVVGVLTPPPLPDFSKYGPVEVQEVSTLRQTIAKNLALAWHVIPMVTQHEVADITELEAGRKRIVEAASPGTPKITMTVLAIKACVAALKEFPHFNSSFDMSASRLILKRYYHIGIAVDTREGLVVPVVRDADKKNIRELAAEVQLLAEKARARKLSLEEMRGGTFTISNLGGIGSTAFTPIVNYPEVAILGLSRSVWQPVVRDGQIVPRLLLPLSLSYDHRVIDGADGCRFLVRIAQLLGDPLRLLLEA